MSWKNSLVARIEGGLGLIPSMGCNARETIKNNVLENSLLLELTDFTVYHNSASQDITNCIIGCCHTAPATRSILAKYESSICQIVGFAFQKGKTKDSEIFFG